MAFHQPFTDLPWPATRYYSASIFKNIVDVHLAVWLTAACGGVQLIGVVASLYTIDSQVGDCF